VGSGAMNFVGYRSKNNEPLTVILVANIITHILGLVVDFYGVFNGIHSIIKFAPVEVTHLFIGIGSMLYLLQ